MIEKIRELLFKIFKKESFIGKIIDKFFTKEIVTYIIFGVLTTAVNLLTFYIFKKIFISIGWNGIFNESFPKIPKLLSFSAAEAIILMQISSHGLQALFLLL